jgi:hypothetical protein
VIKAVATPEGGTEAAVISLPVEVVGSHQLCDDADWKPKIKAYFVTGALEYNYISTATVYKLNGY